MSIRKIFITLIFSGCASSLLSQSTPKYVNEFLHLGVGARYMGMGHGGVSLCNDVYGTYWNPAGLVEIKDNLQVAFMHSNYYQGIANYDFGSIAAKTAPDQAIGFSFIRLGVDGILNTYNLFRNGEIRYDNVTKFSVVDYAFLFSFAQKVKAKRYNNHTINWGANAKLIHRGVGNFANAWGFGLDASLTYEQKKSGWKLAVLARDITSTFNSWEMNYTDDQKAILASTGNVIPKNSLEIGLPRFIFSTSYLFSTDKITINPNIDITMTSDGKRNTLVRTPLFSFDPMAGAEVGYKLKSEENAIFLRFGVWNFQRETNQKGKVNIITAQPTAGVGIKIKNLSLDYALSSFGGNGTGLISNIISLKFAINKKE